MPSLAPGGDWDGTERRSGRRRQRRVYRFVDRRRGWDRRRDYPVLGLLRDEPRHLLLLLAILNLFSLLDAVFTAIELRGGLATEGNPVLLSILGGGNTLAVMGFKVVVIVLVSLLIWYHRDRRLFLGIAVTAMGLYVGVVAYHLWALLPFVVLRFLR